MQIVSNFLTSLQILRGFAHCPLCTGGAGAAAALAALLGFKLGAIAVFMGSFAVAVSLWLPKKIKKKYFKHQDLALFWVAYLSTLAPMYPLLRGDYVSRYVAWSGDYGSLLNRTYILDLFFVGTIAGSLIVYFSPRLSAYISKQRGGKIVRFQGIILTFLLLIVVSVIMQFWPR